MASGNITVTTANKYISGRLAWSSTTDTANNRSTVTATLYLSRTNTGYKTLRTPNITITINGNKKNIVASSQATFAYNSNTNCGSHSVVVPHNADGSKSCAISVSGSLVGSTNYAITTASQTVSLNKIPRYPHISGIVTGGVGRDRIDVKFFSDSICDYWWYSLNNGSTWTGVGSINSSTSVTTITGLSANTTYNITVRIRRKDSQLTMSHTTTPTKTLSIASPNTPTLLNKTCTSTRVNWTSTRTVIRTQYSLNGGGWQNGYSSNFSARTSGYFDITGLTPNKTYSIRIRVLDAVHTGTWSGASGTSSVTTYRLTSSGAPTFSTGKSVTVNLSRPSTSISNDVTLQMWADSQKYIDVATVTQRTTSVTFSLTAAQLNTIYSNRTGSKTASVRLKILNRWGHGGTSQGTSYSSTGTCTIVNANPTIASVSYKDTNATIQGILSDNQKILRGKSTLRVTAGQATSQKYATLKSYKVSIGGSEYTVNTSGTSETGKVINVGKINQSSNQTATLTVTDSRGYTASRNFTVQVLNYVAPQFIRNSADRLNNYEEPTTLNVQARRTVIKPSTSDINTIKMRYRVKENPSGTYGSYITLNPKKTNISGIYQNLSVSQYMADYPTNKSYTVEIGLSDSITGWITRTVTLSEGIAMMKFTQNKINMGVNLDVDGNIYANNIPITPTNIFVEGDANTYYPVRISPVEPFAYHKYSISRRYNATAPSTWNTATHKGGLTFDFEWSGDIAWGGNHKPIRIIEFGQTYTTMVAGLVLTVSGLIVWLRGGGATYNITSTANVKVSATVYLGNFTSGDNKVWAPRTNTNNVASEINAKWPVRNSNLLYDNGKRVSTTDHSHAWSAITSKPSTFAPSSHTHNYAAASHTHSYLPLSGGTTTGTTALGNGRLRVYTTGSGEIRIDNNAGNSTDVTIRPSITDRGNVGTSNYRFDVVRGRVMSSSSNRSSKENINIFDEETAYEQIKDMPIYSFSFEHDSYVDHNIGTMIEYMPVEMLETGKEIYVKPGEEKMYSINNAIFYLMAGFKVAQRKIEDLEEENRDLKSRLERLEEIVLGEEI